VIDSSRVSERAFAGVEAGILWRALRFLIVAGCFTPFRAWAGCEAEPRPRGGSLLLTA
jgi:hypothetical protein